MISFKTFISESALDRKITKGTGATQIDIPGATVIHHDPQKAITVYHLKTPDACYSWGTGSKWCTATKRKNYAHKYLRTGNVFGIHHNEGRYQMYVPKGKDNPNTGEYKDIENNGASSHYQYLPGEVRGKLQKTRFSKYKGPDWEPPPHPYRSMPHHTIVAAIKNLPDQERREHFEAMRLGRGTMDRPIHYGSEDETAIADRFDKNDLHHFHDDPVHATFIAAHANIDDVAHTMGNHPDHGVRHIIQQRVKLAGGMKNILPPGPAPSNFQHHPDQFPMKFGKIQQGKKQQ